MSKLIGQHQQHHTRRGRIFSVPTTSYVLTEDNLQPINPTLSDRLEWHVIHKKCSRRLIPK